MSKGKRMIGDILKERNECYGDFYVEACIVQNIKAELRAYRGMRDDADEVTHNVIREALDHIATKLGRICNGDPTYKDNWQDIIGYCTLVLVEIDRTAK